MKTLISITLVVFITIAAFDSCKMPPLVKPADASVSDTSTTLIANTTLVGNWNIVTDTVSFRTDTMYHGTSADHYIFTKYGNMYVKCALNNYIDTAVYTISNTNRLDWTNSYSSQAGAVIKGPTHNGYFDITTITAHSLVLTQNIITTVGPRFEVVTLKK